MEAFKDNDAGGVHPILKQALKVKQAMTWLYVLMLLYLGQQKPKSNMKMIPAIYQIGVPLAE